MKWTKTCNRFVAFYDIMGFKDMVQRNSHSAILARMNKLKAIINPIEEDLTKFLNQESSLSEKDKIDLLKTAAKPVIFSDSILIVTNGESDADFFEIIFSSMWLMRKCFETGIPIKGAVSFGKFTADFENSIYFGQPLIDAYLLQDELAMYATIYDHNFENFTQKKKLKHRALKTYRTPLKSGKINHLLMDWIYVDNRDESYKKQINRLYRSVSGRPRIYVDNTLEFLEFLIKEKQNLKK